MEEIKFDDEVINLNACDTEFLLIAVIMDSLGLDSIKIEKLAVDGIDIDRHLYISVNRDEIFIYLRDGILPG